MVNALITFPLRGAQLLFSVVVLGLSVGLIKGDHGKHLPATLGFAAFVAGVSLLGGFIGIAAFWVELLQGVIGAGIDAVVLLVNVAGGILIAYKLRGLNCNNSDEQYRWEKLNNNNLLNGGCDKYEGQTYCFYWVMEQYGKLNSRCREAQADSVFMFLNVVILIVCLTMTFLHLKK